jgi:hypothetical protein
LSQKRDACGKTAAQRGQAASSRTPQCLQNFAPSRLDVLQFGQLMAKRSDPTADYRASERGSAP